MIHTSKQLKDKVRNISRGDNEVAKALIRIFIMERFLERVSLSKYKNNFILKGGIPLEDGVCIRITSVTKIMTDFEYPSIRMMLEATLDRMRQPIKLDISTDDVITPAAVEYEYKLMFEDRTISLLSYNTETLLAEKMQMIVTRGLANTRMRDFYDIFGITKLNEGKIEDSLLIEAFWAICKKRETVLSKSEIEEILLKIRDDEPLAEMWEQFRKKNFFVGDLQWEAVLQKVIHIMERLFE